MIITAAQLAALLEPENQGKNSPAYKATHHKKGPRYFDIWRRVMNDKDGFLEIESARAKQKKKKIIVSNALLNDFATTSGDLAFFTTLIENYEVYIWHGSHQSLLTQQPLHTSEEFWQKTQNIYPASERAVKEGLADQKLPVDDYIILDWVAYTKLIKQLDNTVYRSDSLDLTTLDITDKDVFDRLKKSFDPVRITKITILAPNPKEIDLLFELFPKLESVAIQCVTATWITQYLTKFNGLNVELSGWGDRDENYWVLPDDLNILKLSIKQKLAGFRVRSVVIEQFDSNDEDSFINEDSFAPEAKIESLSCVSRSAESMQSILSSTYLKKINIIIKNYCQIDFALPAASNLIDLSLVSYFIHSLDLANSACLEKLKVNGNLQSISNFACPNLRELAITAGNQLQENFSHLTRLERLNWDLRVVQPLTLNIPTLKYLNIRVASSHVDLQTIDCSYLTMLEELALTNCDQLNGLVSPSLKKFELSGYPVERLPTLDCSRLVGLEEFAVTRSGALPNLRYSPIKKLRLDKCETVEIAFAEFNHLEELTISGCDQLTHLKNLQNTRLREISISHCHNLAALELPELTSLKRVTIRYCQSLAALNFIKLSQLEVLTIDDCQRLAVLENLNCPWLKELTIARCHVLTSINYASLLSLETLVVSGSINLSILKNLPNQTLKALIIYHLPKEQALDHAEIDLDFSQFNVLEIIDLASCELTKIKWPSNGSLKRLKIMSCTTQDGVLDLTSFQYIEELVISGCDEKIKKIIWSDNITVKKLYIFNTNIELLDLSNVNDVEEIDTHYEKEKIKLPSNTASIKRIKCRGQILEETISFLKFPQLEVLEITSANLKLENFPKLKKIAITPVAATFNYEVVNCPELTEFSSRYCDGHNLILTLRNVPKLAEVCLGSEDFKADSIQFASDCKNLRKFIVHAANAQSVVRAVQQQWPNCFVYTPMDRSEKTQQVKPKQELQLRAPSVKPRSLSIEENRLNRFNKSSTTSVFSAAKVGPIKVDGDTGVSAVRKASGTSRLVFHAKSAVSKNSYRLAILDRVQWKNRELKFLSSVLNDEKQKYKIVEIKLCPWNEKRIAQLIESVTQDDQFTVAYFESQFEKNKIYMLPTLQPLQDQDIQIFCDPADAIELIWHTGQQQYYFQLSPHSPSESVKLFYCHQQNHHYVDALDLKHPLVVKSDLLSSDLILMLIKKLNFSGSPIKFLFDQERSVEQKIAQLIEYCDAFRVERLDDQFKNQFDTLCAIILQRKGVCRHRTEAFVILAHLIGVPARAITNELHAFVELPIRADDGSVHYRKVDLGGGEELDLTPHGVREDLLASITQSAKKTMPKEKTPRQLPSDTSPLEKYYRSEIIARVEQQQLHSVNDLTATNNPPLIELTPNQNPLEIGGQIERQLADAGFNTIKNYIYIDTPEDLSLYWWPWIYADGTFKRDEESGPLKKLVRNGGVLIVNWSNFSSREMVRYQSLLDTSPTIFGEKLHEHLKVIGLKKVGTESCSAFLSRCQSWTLLADFIIKSVPQTVTIERTKQEIDLFGSFTWRETLFGKLVTTHHGKQLEEGELIKAIRLNQAVAFVICNPPTDEEFQRFLDRIRAERKLFYNGEWLALHPAFVISTLYKTHRNELPENVRVIGHVPEAQRRRIYLNLNNMYECVNWLDIFRSDEDVFYFTETIPQPEWQKLLVHIQEASIDKVFSFCLAPGVAIENVVENTEPPLSLVLNPNEVLSTQHNVITTNDPDYVSAQLAAAHQNSLVVDVTPQMDFSDLFYEIRDADARSLSLSYEEHGVLKALQAGRTVILNGELRPGFYQQILPILDGSKQIFYKGKVIELSGRLIAVIPESARSALNLQQSVSCHYTIDDYQNIFEHGKFDCIQKFFEQVQKLPHRDFGMPEMPALSHQRIKRMLAALSTEHPLHANNPIKGLFHYDYPRHSESYAYLNVVAKHLFQPEKQMRMRRKQLDQLIERFDIRSSSKFKDYVWQILNCCDDKTRKDVLGENFVNLDCASGYPALASEALQNLYEIIFRKKQPLAVEESKPVRAYKQVAQLKVLLKDENTSIIILKGPAGVGKTFAVRRSLDKYYEGEQGFIDWLKHGGVWLVDEGNLAVPGTWDFLKALSRGEKKIYYQDREYQLNARHKVIVTGNPETYPGRFYHKFFQEHAETLYFQRPEAAYLERVILKNILPERLYKEYYIQGLLKASRLIEQYNPFFEISVRDLENLAQRFMFLARDAKDDRAIQQSLFTACRVEFAGVVKDVAVRQDFIEALSWTLGADYVEHNQMQRLSTGYILTPEKAYLLEAIEHDLLLRRHMLENSNAYYKSAIILEGASGVGKSTLFRVILNKLAIPYLEMSAGTEDAAEKLKNAFDNGEVVVLDELNVDDKLEKLLNHYLTGVHADGKPAKIPGFMLLASQNPAYFAGRHTSSVALLSRMHFLYADEFTEDENIAIADAEHVAYPKALQQAFKTVADKNPTLNQRTYFGIVKDFKSKAVPPEVDSEQASFERKSLVKNFVAALKRSNTEEIYQCLKNVTKEELLSVFNNDKNRLDSWVIENRQYFSQLLREDLSDRNDSAKVELLQTALRSGTALNYVCEMHTRVGFTFFYEGKFILKETRLILELRDQLAKLEQSINASAASSSNRSPN